MSRQTGRTRYGPGVAAVLVALATAGYAQVDEANLVAYWQFEDSGYTTAVDSVDGITAEVNDGNGAPGSFGTGGISGQAWISGDDGSTWPNQQSDYLSVTSSVVSLVGEDSFALTGWFKISGLNPGAVGVGTGTGNNHFFDTDRGGDAPEGWRISMMAGQGDPPQAVELFFYSNGTGLTISNPFGGWETNKWYFMAATVNAGSGIFWIAREGDTWAGRYGNAGAMNAPAGGEPLRLGRAGGAGAFNGLRDEFSIWNRALTPAEAEQIFNAGLAGRGLDTLLEKVGFNFTALAVGSDTALEFLSETGETYRLDFKTNALDEVWSSAPHRYLGSDALIQAFDPDGFSTQKTYRIRVE